MTNRPFCTKPRAKTADQVPSGSFKPEERVSATTGGGEPGVNQPQKPQQKQDSISDELPGENMDAPESEFFGPGDMSSHGEKQAILDYSPCSWMAQQLLSGEMEAEGLPQDAVAETREGTMLVSVSICREVCPHFVGCYGLRGDQADAAEERIAAKTASSGGVSPDMPEILAAEKLLRMKLGTEQAARFLVSRGFSGQAAAGVLRMMEGLRGS